MNDWRVAWRVACLRGIFSDIAPPQSILQPSLFVFCLALGDYLLQRCGPRRPLCSMHAALYICSASTMASLVLNTQHRVIYWTRNNVVRLFIVRAAPKPFSWTAKVQRWTIGVYSWPIMRNEVGLDQYKPRSFRSGSQTVPLRLWCTL